ncbi:AbrB/MazE/SpoVT family DNA-binding domain-containing protein [Sphingobium sp. RAC03]|uniref:AbrB/MazE/SpoVT family DNA-binding domain-containing protein n=1 Tax=Sphingobium sp. RAC03 TaxID=1843368 RepID=UPI00083D237B|nr:AbrB/MazE/SpoVT family DNA-binding domain-containing protein [Sphingobium sp. RAC03]AOF97024.1 antidote-toxin recognition MazE family protein [Sphingobium sp. RAC03]
MTYSGKMISGGKAVIPAELRRQLGFKDGDRIIFERQGSGILVKSYDQVLREVQADLKALIKKPFTVDDFLAERRTEAHRE